MSRARLTPVLAERLLYAGNHNVVFIVHLTRAKISSIRPSPAWGESQPGRLMLMLDYLAVLLSWLSP